MHKHELDSLNILMGQVDKLATKEQSVQTVGGCYKPPTPPPVPLPLRKIKKIESILNF